MVDSINSSSVTANRARNTGATGSRDAGAPTGSTPANAEPAASDEVKVKQMRQAIEDGSFPLDARRIAENFAELERLI
jgi:anti-sigma28 factor (negative regulator of flagellin synthesis)